jgi:hypothetical protein
MEQDLKQIIRQEYLLCAKDPAHFMQKYCHIQHPQRGRILFNLYPFQGKVLNVWKDNPYSIVLKSRQLGISTLAAGYSLWLMTFHKDKNVLCLATTQETAKNMVTKVKFMYDNLPSWLKVPSEENNKLALKLSNGSQIKAKSSNSDAARSEAVSLLLIDEAAFIDNIAETWASAQQTLATGGGAIVLSTPYGTGNWFHQTWVNAENSDNSFLPIKLPWFVHPERDQKWRDQQDKDLGLKAAAQECDCDFSTSGDVVFHNDWLDYISQTTIQEPLERRGVDQNLWIWESVDYSREYVVVADVARGDGADSSTFHVLDVATNTQVAEFKGQLPTREFGYLLVTIATEYNNALLVVENNSIGWATIDTIIERGYRNLYHSPKSDQLTSESYLKTWEGSSDLTPGFTINLRNRPLIINKFREYIGDRSVTIRSKRLLEEMKVFIWKNGRAEAQSGYNDDLVMPFGVGMFLRDTSLKFQQQSLDMTRAALGGMKRNTTSYSGGYSAQSIQNPYSMEIGGKNENINWLL